MPKSIKIPDFLPQQGDNLVRGVLHWADPLSLLATGWRKQARPPTWDIAGKCSRKSELWMGKSFISWTWKTRSINDDIYEPIINGYFYSGWFFGKDNLYRVRKGDAPLPSSNTSFFSTMLSTAAEVLATKPPQRQSPAAWCTFQERRDALWLGWNGAVLGGPMGPMGPKILQIGVYGESSDLRCHSLGKHRNRWKSGRRPRSPCPAAPAADPPPNHPHPTPDRLKPA